MSLIKLPPGMTPSEYWASPEGQRTAAHQKRFQDELAQKQSAAAPGPAFKPPPGRRPVSGGQVAPSPPGQAQPKVAPDAAATRPQDSARNQIAAALQEMFPELDPGKIQVLSAQLAAEYQRERTAAVDSLRPKAPMAEPTEQMEFDEAYQGMRANERAEDRMRQRMEQQLRKEEAEQRRMEQARQAAAGRRPPRKLTPPGMAQPVY
jgi:hypothetical protein